MQCSVYYYYIAIDYDITKTGSSVQKVSSTAAKGSKETK